MLLINKLRLSLNWKKIDFTLILIGQTKRKFCDRFSEHRGYVSQKKFDQVCGEHFNKAGHSQSDMLPIILEQVTPKNDDF